MGAGGASALAFSLALPPWDLVLLLTPAFLLLAAALHLLPEGPERPRCAALAGACFGGIHAAVTLHWIPAAASAYMGTPAAVAAGLAVWGLHAAVAGLAFWAASAASRLPMALAAAGAWVVLTALPGALPLLALPWPGPEAALAQRPTGALLLPLLGSTGTGALMAGAAGWGLGGSGRRALGFLALVFVWVVGDGLAARDGGMELPAASMPEREREVQGKRGVEGRWITLVELQEVAAPAFGWDAAEAVGASPPVREAWPETMGSPDYLAHLAEWGGREGRSVLAGVHRVRDGRRRNVAILLEGGEERSPPPSGAPRSISVDPATGGLPGRTIHEKGRLVPGVERTHFLGAGEEGRGIVPGQRGAPFSWKGLPTGVLICFEILFPGEVARLRHEGAELLLQLTGETALDPGRADRPPLLPLLADAPRQQHVAYLRARGVEFRMPVARSAVAGPTGGWDHRGRPLPEEEVWEGRGARGVGMRIPPAPDPPLAIWIQPLSLPLGTALLLLGLGLGPRRPPGGSGSERRAEP